jgi:peptidoglycan/LPS O-acetylase OafA/YrhL
LRFFAAAAVVLAHLESMGVPLLASNGGAGIGYEAVTFFFVLSGFILVYVYSGSRESDGLSVTAGQFLAARFARIGPGYYLGLLLVLPVFLYRAYFVHLIPPESSVAALVLAPAFMQAWFPPAALAWNGPAWSLSVEVAFYVLFPFLLRQSNRLTRAQFFTVAVCAVAATAIARRAWPLMIGTGSSGTLADVTYAHPLFHLAWFLLGMALGRLYLFGPPLPRRAREVLSAFGRPLSTRWLVLLGESSFSTYILHTGLVFWFHWILREAFGVVPAGNADYALTFGFVLVAALFAYKFFEKPMRGWILERALDRTAMSPGAVPRVSSANG